MGEGEVGIRHLTGPLKSLLLFLSILVLVIPAVWWCVESDSRIDSVEKSVKEIAVESEEKFKEVDSSIEDVEDKVVLLEKHEIERIGEYKALGEKLNRTESTLQLVLVELKRLERGE